MADDDEEDMPDLGILDDFNTYLETLISRSKLGKGNVDVGDKAVEKFLSKAEVKFLGFPNDSKLKQNRDREKRLISRKTSVFKNKSAKEAQYLLRACAEDSVMAQVTTKSGFSLGVSTGLVLGGPTGGGGLLVGGTYSRERERTRGSYSTSRREMEASAPVDPDNQLVATESVYHTDYEAFCKFDFAIKDDYELKCKISSKKKTVKVKDIGFKECEQDFATASSERRVHVSGTFKTTLTSIEHQIDFEVEPMSKETK